MSDLSESVDYLAQAKMTRWQVTPRVTEDFLMSGVLDALISIAESLSPAVEVALDPATVCQCGHARRDHIYDEGACRTGRVCERGCGGFMPADDLPTRPPVQYASFGQKPVADHIIDTTTPSFCTWCGHLLHTLRCRGNRDEHCNCEHTPDDDDLTAAEAEDDLLSRAAVLLALRWNPLWVPGDIVDVMVAVREAATYLERPDGACPDCAGDPVCSPICTTACRNGWPTTTEESETS